MKKVNKLLFLILTLFIGNNIVKAAPSLYAGSDFDVRSGVVITAQNRSYTTVNMPWYLYTLTDQNGKKYPAYCRNSNKEPGSGEFKITEVLNNTGLTNNNLKAYNAGIAAIIKNSKYSQGSGNNSMYVATNLALRAFENLWENFDSNGGHCTTANINCNTDFRNYITHGIANEIINSYSAKVKEAVGTSVPLFISSTVRSYSITAGGTTSTIHNEAKRLILIGLDASINNRKNGSSSFSISDTPLVNSKPVTIDENSNKVYSKSYSHSFSFKDFTSDESYIKLTFNCTNCSDYNVDYELFINDVSYGQQFPEDLLKEDFVENGTAEGNIKVEFTTTSENYNCEPIDYRIDYEYYDETIGEPVYEVQARHCAYGASGCQSFYVIDLYTLGETGSTGTGDGEKISNSINESIELCDPDCSKLKEDCDEDTANGDPDSENCQRLEEQCDETIGCTAYVDNVECSDVDSDISLTEGYVIDGTTCQVPSSADVLSCVVNGKDVNDISYKAPDLMNNDYCSVWCKEDYKFTLPGNQNTVSGRYFTLQTSIHGAKTCYSNINRKEFDQEYENIRKQAMEAYNNWASYASAAAAYENGNLASSGRVEHHRRHSCGRNCTCSWGGSYKEASSYQPYEYVWSFQAYNPNVANAQSPIPAVNSLDIKSTFELPVDPDGDFTTSLDCLKSGTTVTCTYKSPGYSVCNHSDCYSKNGFNLNIDEIKRRRDDYADTLNGLIGRLNNLVSTFNTCDNWTMEYEYNPEIDFDYEESYMENVYTNKLDTIGTVEQKEVKKEYCNYLGLANAATGTSNYGEVVNNAYDTCTNGGWQSSPSDESLQKMICSTEDGYNGCSPKTVSIMKTQRMRETIEVDAKYITPNQFWNLYPTGSVVVSGDTEVEIENSNLLENELAVGLGTSQGVWTWGLVVKNLGEYYDTHNLGRIWGSPSNVVDTVTSKKNVCLEDGGLKSESQIGDNYYDNGVYVCAYKVNCPDCPVVCDDTGCYNPDCPENNCPVVCDNCLFTNGKLNLNYRPVTTADLNPNDRNLGSNWNYQSSSSSSGNHTNTTNGSFNITTALELKAYATTREIEEAGDKIYDVTFEDSQTSSPDTNYAVEITFDAGVKNFIKEYNDHQEANGGYADNSLECYDYTKDGTTYKNIFCYSKFLDEMYERFGSSNKIKFSKYRPMTEEQRKTQSDSYWTTWSEFNREGTNWNITTSTGLVYNTNYGNIGVGPSWK